MLNIKCGREITVQIHLDGQTPTLHARGTVIDLDTLIPITDGVKFLNSDLNIAIEVTDEILVTSPIACVRVYAPDALAQIQQYFINSCTL